VSRSSTPSATVGKVVKVLCSECKRATNHLVEASFDTAGTETDYEGGWSIDWSDHHQVVRCQGCDTVSFRQTSWFSEGDDEPSVRLYPVRTVDTIASQSFLNLPPALKRIYGEVVDCYNNGNLTLCAAGLRAIVEGVCADRLVVDGPVEVPLSGGLTKTERRKSLDGKIAGLHEKGLLTQDSAATLHDLRFLGNDAVHELKRPSEEDLKLAIEIIEHTLHQLYEIPAKALALNKSIGRSSPPPTSVV